MSDWRALSKRPDQWKDLKHNDTRLDEFAMEVEKRNGLPPGMLVALKNAGERSDASMGASNKGARGVMQFMPKEAQQFKHNVNDPFESINAAGAYMKTLLKENATRWNNLRKGEPPDMALINRAAMANYNGGPKQAASVLMGKEPEVKETRDYLHRILKYLDARKVPSVQPPKPEYAPTDPRPPKDMTSQVDDVKKQIASLTEELNKPKTFVRDDTGRISGIAQPDMV